MSMPNVYHHRRVAATASKPCYICYKPTTSVLNQADGKDWFYTCPGHLADTGFAQPIVTPEEQEAKRKKEELDKEIAKIKEEYEEKQKKKKGNKKKEKDKDKDKDKDKEKEKDKDAKEDDKDEKERDEKIKSLEEKSGTSASKADDGPRIYSLHKNIYQMRITRIKNAQQAKQTQALLRDPNAFPSVPKGGI